MTNPLHVINNYPVDNLQNSSALLSFLGVFTLAFRLELSHWFLGSWACQPTLWLHTCADTHRTCWFCFSREPWLYIELHLVREVSTFIIIKIQISIVSFSLRWLLNLSQSACLIQNNSLGPRFPQPLSLE